MGKNKRKKKKTDNGHRNPSAMVRTSAPRWSEAAPGPRNSAMDPIFKPKLPSEVLNPAQNSGDDTPSQSASTNPLQEPLNLHLETEAVQGKTTYSEKTAIQTIQAQTEPDAMQSIQEQTPCSQLGSEGFLARLQDQRDELKWLYCELYQDYAQVQEYFDHLINTLASMAANLPMPAKNAKQAWLPDTHNTLGMQLDPAAFAGSFAEASEKIAYLKECQAAYLTLFPVFEHQTASSANAKPYQWLDALGSQKDREMFFSRCREADLRLGTAFSLRTAADQLDYQNPEAFERMSCQLLHLINDGFSFLILDDLDDVWNYDGAYCRNFMPIHHILRMLRILTEAAAPELLLIGESAKTDTAASYLGIGENPECHMFSSREFAATLWHTVATRNVDLLLHELHQQQELPKHTPVLRALRGYDAMTWHLNYDYLKTLSMEREPHISYLNEYLTGNFPDTFARGESYPLDSYLEEAALCGTTASLCGVEKAGAEEDVAAMERAITLDLMLHALLMSVSDLPVLYSGDEIGQTNDYSYRQSPDKSFDSRRLHQGAFSWELAQQRKDPGTVSHEIFETLQKLYTFRKEHPAFHQNAKQYTLDTWDSSVLCLVREYDGEKWIGLYNFSTEPRIAWINAADGLYTNLISGEKTEAKGIELPAGDFFWLIRE